MNGKILFCLLILCLSIGVVSADTLILTASEDSYTGTARSASYTFGDLRDDAGTAAGIVPAGFNRTDVFNYAYLYYYVGGYRNMGRGLMSFNLSTLSAGSTITGAELDLYGNYEINMFSSEQGFTITNASPAEPSLHVYTDYATFRDYQMIDTNLTIATYNAAGWNNMTMNSAAVAYLQSRGSTNASFMGRLASEFDGSLVGSPANYKSYQIRWNSDNAASNKPQLTLTYTPAAGGDPPVASFTKNQTAGVAPLPVGFTDTSTNTPDEWHWWVNNVTGNDTPYEFASTQNPSITLGIGNWSFALNASNAYGWNITPGYDWVNVTAAPEGCGLLCKIVRYFWQFRLPVQLVMAS